MVLNTGARFPIPRYKISLVGTTLDNLSDTEKWKRVIQKMLTNIGLTVQQEIIALMQSGIFKDPSSRGAQNIKMRVDPEAMRVSVFTTDDAHYLFFQEHGVERQPMAWLLYDRIKKKIPFVIIGEKFHWAGYGSEHFANPDKRFAKVTQEKLNAGKWWQPGYEGKFFFKEGIERAMVQLDDVLKGRFAIEVAREE